MYDLCVIIVTYNAERTIKECIESITIDGNISHRIVVVDNRSTDSTRNILGDFKNIDVILNSLNVGFGAANNVGVRSCPARYYYLHNSDAYLRPFVIERAMEIMDENKNLGIASLPLVFPDGSPQVSGFQFSTPLKWTLQVLRVEKLILKITKFKIVRNITLPLLKLIPMSRNYVYTIYNANANKELRYVDWVSGASMLFTADAMSTVKGFDENIFLYSEDEDICRRVRSAGFQVAIVPTDPIVHELGWNQQEKRNNYSDLKYKSKSYFIDKHWKNSILTRKYMHILLRLKKLFLIS